MVEKSVSSYRSRDPLSMVVAPASFQTFVFSPWLFDGRRNLPPQGNPGSVIVPQYGSSKITVFVWGKNTILQFVGNTKYNIVI